MRRILGRRPNSLVGLDIGSAWLKLVELSHDAAGRHRVEAFGAEPLPPGTVADHYVNDLEGLAAAIKRLFRHTGARRGNVATAVGGASVFTTLVEMDASLTDAELTGRVIDQAARHIPFPIAEVALDFEVQHLSEANPDQVEVLLAACRAEEVEARQAALTQSGCRPRVVDIEALATRRAFEQLRRQGAGAAADAPIAFIDVGFAATKVSVFAGDEALAGREIAFGARQLGHHGTNGHGAPPPAAAAPEDALAGDDATLLAPFAESLAERVGRAIEFCLAGRGDGKVERAFLAGGAATAAALGPLLGDALGAPTAIADPFHGMDRADRLDAPALTRLAPALAIACGLALWEGQP